MYTWGYLKSSTLAKLDLTESEAENQNFLASFPYYANEVITQVCSSVKPKYSFAKFVITKDNLLDLHSMPEDFVSFGDDVCYQVIEICEGKIERLELNDTDFTYVGYNQVQFYHIGTYYISYNARWYTFAQNMDNQNIMNNTPEDILDCIPSYIASQCLKIDDEYKATVFRNEYETLLARIDNTNFKNTKTLIIDGGW